MSRSLAGRNGRARVTRAGKMFGDVTIGLHLTAGSKRGPGWLRLVSSTARRPPVLAVTDCVGSSVLCLTIFSIHRTTFHDANTSKKKEQKFHRSVLQAIYKNNLVPIHKVIELWLVCPFSPALYCFYFRAWCSPGAFSIPLRYYRRFLSLVQGPAGVARSHVSYRWGISYYIDRERPERSSQSRCGSRILICML